MISFETSQGEFTYRAAGIAIVAGRVLLHRSVGQDYWILPGGRVEMMEPARITLAREMQEETGQAFDVGRLVWFSENFFVARGQPFHEIGLYFKMQPRAAPTTLTFTGQEGDQELEFRWHPVAQLHTLALQPAFLSAGLADLPAVTTHIVQR